MNDIIKSIFNSISTLRESRADALNGERVIFVKGGVDVFSAEGLYPSPDLFGGYFETCSPESFLDYSASVFDMWEEGGVDRHCAVFIDDSATEFEPPTRGELVAIAIYDYGSIGNPRWGDHRAKFVSLATPLMAAVHDGRRFNQEDFLGFLREFPDERAPRFFSAGTLLSPGESLAFFEDLTIAKITKSSTAMPKGGKVQFNRGTSFAEEVLGEAPIPDRMEVMDSVYEGFPPRPVSFRVVLKATCAFPEIILEEMDKRSTRVGLAMELGAMCEQSEGQWSVFRGRFSMRSRPQFSREIQNEHPVVG